MKILFLKSVKNIGQSGEIKEVSDGYARNFLIPKGFGEAITKGEITIVEAKKRKAVRLKKEEAQAKLKLARKIDKKEFIIKAKADEKGTLYGGLDKRLLAKFFNSEGYSVDEEEIKLAEHIKKTGNYELSLQIAGQKSSVNLKVIPEA